MSIDSTTEADAAEKVRQGAIEESRGAIQEAESLFRSALEMCRGTGARPERAACVNLAKLCADENREFEALALSRKGARLCEAAGDEWGLALSRLHLANALFRIEDFDRLQHVLKEVEWMRRSLEPARQNRLALSLALHHARMSAMQGDVDTALVALAEAESIAQTIGPGALDPRIPWLVRVAARNVAGQFEQAAPYLENIPAIEPEAARRKLEVETHRVWCLLGLRPDPEGRAAAKSLFEAIQEAPVGSLGTAWRLRTASDLAAVLVRRLGLCDETRMAWDVAGRAALDRVAEIESCVETLPELAEADADVFELLKEYHRRFRERHDNLLQEVARVASAGAATGRIPLATLVAANGFIAVCAWCARVRTSSDRWIPVRQFLPRHDDRLTHGVCPDCLPQLVKAVLGPKT